MADATQAFPSAFMKADDLLAGAQTLTIQKVNLRHEFNDGSSKPVIEFAGDKSLVCNKTNWNIVIEMYGTNTDAWLGKPLTLTRQMVDFQGKRTPAIRINPVTVPMQQTNGAPSSNGHSAPAPAVSPNALMKTWIAKYRRQGSESPAADELTAKLDELAAMCYGAFLPDAIVDKFMNAADTPEILNAMWDAVNALIGKQQGDVHI